MAAYITIDSGTTNTRISLVVDNRILDTLRFNVGAGKSFEHRDILKNTVKCGIGDILSKNGLKEPDILRILACGMLTSEFGIYELEHTIVPAGIGELHDSMKEVVLSDITEIPFVFMRGVKTSCSSFDEADIMRGEETELVGLTDDIRPECTYVLPGSHSKIIKTDERGRISSFCTMMTGEMLAALSGNTLLKSAVRMDGAELEREYLFKGFEFCQENGINRAAFKVRILKNMFSESDDEVYSFFIGVVLCGEILEIVKQNPKMVVIGGRKQIKEAMAELLSRSLEGEIICVPDESADHASARGMVKIFEYR